MCDASLLALNVSRRPGRVLYYSSSTANAFFFYIQNHKIHENIARLVSGIHLAWGQADSITPITYRKTDVPAQVKYFPPALQIRFFLGSGPDFYNSYRSFSQIDERGQGKVGAGGNEV